MGILAKEFYLFEPRRTSIGLDIGEKSIKIAVLKETPKETQVLKLIQRDIALIQGQDEKAKEEAVVSTIQKIIKEENIMAKNAYTNIPWEKLQVRIASAPYVPEHELRQGLRYEVQQHFPFPLENASLDYMIIDDVAGAEGRMYELVVVACPNEIVEKRIALLERVGLKPQLLGIAPLALFETIEPEKRGGVIALLDIKDSQANLSIFMKKRLRFIRDISLRQSLSSSSESVEELVIEVGRTIDFYRAQSRVEKIDQVVFSGESAGISNLGNMLTERLGISCEKANPLKNINIKKEKPVYREETLPGFTTSIGLALSSKKGKTINLLPERFIKKRLSFPQKFIPWFMPCILVMIIASMHAGILIKKNGLINKRNEFARRVNEFRNVFNELSLFESDRKKTEEKIRFINNKIEEQKMWPGLLRAISDVIPEELWLTSLKSNYTKKTRLLELNGYGFSNQATVEFVSGLKKTTYFDEVKLNFIRAEEVAKRKVVSFEIICKFKEAE